MYIGKDEMYNWMPESNEKYADAEIPPELGLELEDAITNYKRVCGKIYQYLDKNPTAIKSEYE